MVVGGRQGQGGDKGKHAGQPAFDKAAAKPAGRGREGTKASTRASGGRQVRHPPSSRRRAGPSCRLRTREGRCGIRPAATGCGRMPRHRASGMPCAGGYHMVGRLYVLPHKRASPGGGNAGGWTHAGARAVRPAVRLTVRVKHGGWTHAGSLGIPKGTQHSRSRPSKANANSTVSWRGKKRSRGRPFPPPPLPPPAPHSICTCRVCGTRRTSAIRACRCSAHT